MPVLPITHIASDPTHRGGKPRIQVAGIAVQNIVEDIQKGMTPDEIVEAFDLTLGQIYAALSYYYDHKNEIDRSIAEDQSWRDTLPETEAYKASEAWWKQLQAQMDALKSNERAQS